MANKFNPMDSKLAITVDGMGQNTYKFLPWLADRIMASEIDKRDPFVNPSARAKFIRDSEDDREAMDRRASM